MGDCNIGDKRVRRLLECLCLLERHVGLSSARPCLVRLRVVLHSSSVPFLIVKVLDVLELKLGVQYCHCFVSNFKLWQRVFRIKIVAEVLAEVVVNRDDLVLFV